VKLVGDLYDPCSVASPWGAHMSGPWSANPSRYLLSDIVAVAGPDPPTVEELRVGVAVEVGLADDPPMPARVLAGEQAGHLVPLGREPLEASLPVLLAADVGGEGSGVGDSLLSLELVLQRGEAPSLSQGSPRVRLRSSVGGSLAIPLQRLPGVAGLVALALV